MSAGEVLYGTPEWEVDLLVAGLEVEFADLAADTTPAPSPGRLSLIEED